MQNPQRHRFRRVLRHDQIAPQLGDDGIEQSGAVDGLLPGGRLDQEEPFLLLAFLATLGHLGIERRLADAELFGQFVASPVVRHAVEVRRLVEDAW